MATQEEPEIENEEEVLFIEDRRPGNVSPLFNNSKSTGENVKSSTFLEDFIPLSSASEKEISSISESAIDGNFEPPVSVSIDLDSSAEEDLLCVMEDRNPLLTGQQTHSPRYSISENFLKLQNADTNGPSKRNRFANPCFNCGDTSHPLRDCPLPRNHREIARNRKEFMESKPSQPVYKRYHLDKSQDQFGNSAPGTISSELRRALGLDDRELPSYIYMMRRLGYPPGWLREAIVSHSGISMFDGHGKKVSEPGAEQTEMSSHCSQDKYDVRKIIHYPGFNTPPPEGTYEDAEYWKCPPMSKRQSVEAMLERLGGRVVGGYKRRKLKHNAGGEELNESSQSMESYDMEYEEISENVELPEDNCKFVPPLPDQDLPPPPPMESPESPDPITESPESPDAADDKPLPVEETSIVELEEQKKLLLAELNDVTPLCGTPDSKIGKTKAVDFGTPILKSVSPFSRLPSSEKFSVNICDVINFENLPDSTGKYEQMSGIIKKVRNVLKQYNNEQC